MKNIRLSQHFTLNEMIKSNTARRYGINNIPNKQQVDNLNNLVFNIFEPARSDLGFPIIINSGFRCGKLNMLLKGSPTSDHPKGEAGDAELLGANNALLFDYILNNCEFDQLIWEYGDDEEPEWVHASYKSDGTNRKQVLRAIRKDCKTQYIEL